MTIVNSESHDFKAVFKVSGLFHCFLVIAFTQFDTVIRKKKLRKESCDEIISRKRCVNGRFIPLKAYYCRFFQLKIKTQRSIKNLLQLYKAFQCHIVGFYNILVSGKSVLTKAPLKKSRSEIVEGCAFHFTCDRRPLNTRHPL